MVWAVSILNCFFDKKVFRSLRSITGLRSPVFWETRNSAVEAWSIVAVDSFQSTIVHLLNFCVDLRIFAVQAELGLWRQGRFVMEFQIASFFYGGHHPDICTKILPYFPELLIFPLLDQFGFGKREVLAGIWLSIYLVAGKDWNQSHWKFVSAFAFAWELLALLVLILVSVLAAWSSVTFGVFELWHDINRFVGLFVGFQFVKNWLDLLKADELSFCFEVSDPTLSILLMKASHCARVLMDTALNTWSAEYKVVVLKSLMNLLQVLYCRVREQIAPGVLSFDFPGRVLNIKTPSVEDFIGGRLTGWRWKMKCRCNLIWEKLQPSF